MVSNLEHLDRTLKAQVPFGRSRFLGLLGGALFGVATAMVAPKAAEACDVTPCYGACFCSCCSPTNGGTCCSAGCTSASPCPSGHCWYVCYASKLWTCCDWTQSDGTLCICNQYQGNC